jgi:hypothetical protein
MLTVLVAQKRGQAEWGRGLSGSARNRVAILFNQTGWANSIRVFYTRLVVRTRHPVQRWQRGRMESGYQVRGAKHEAHRHVHIARFAPDTAHRNELTEP